MKKLLLILLFVSGLSSAQQYQDIGDTRLKHENGVFSIGPKPNKSAVPQLFKYPTTFQELVTMTNFEVDTATADVFVGSGALLTSIPQSAVTSLVTDLSGKQSTLTKDGSGGYVGLTLFKINFRNAANTFTSFLTNANTAARTYTFQDRDGTILDGTNLVTGSTDNAILRADGTGGVTTQSSGITIDDSSNIVLPTTAAISQTGIIYKGGLRFIHNYKGQSSSAGANFFAGLLAGNLTMNSVSFTYEASNNVGIGDNALLSLTTGFSNTAIGVNALTLVTTGSANFGLGANSLSKVVTGVSNLGVGTRSGQYTTGSYNTLVGTDAGGGVSGSSSFSNSVGIGYYSLKGSKGGGNNIAIGYKSNEIGETGTGNITIGYDIDPTSTSVSNELNIGATLYGNVSTKTIGVNITPPNITSTFQVNGSVSYSYVAKTANYTATISDYTIDCNTNTFTITLPAAASITGRIYVVRNATSGTTITVDGNASETIDGATTVSLATQYSRVTIQSNGTNWIILSQ